MTFLPQLRKYLERRAVTSPWQLTGDVHDSYRAAIVIPALAERQSLPAVLASLATNPKHLLDVTLVVVVVNNRGDATPDQGQDNHSLLDWLAIRPVTNLHLAWIDASHPGLELPPGEGVGLARKIGFDGALSHLDWDSRPLLVSLDADTLVDADYLTAIFAHFKQHTQGGAVLPFRHQTGGDVHQEVAIRDYELYLRSYLLGLQLAGSPYAWHSIGSAFACTASAYVAAGGMNRRLAGEDFYFLQQLQKTTGVRHLRGTVVHPAARVSQRVPFGTGQVVLAQIAGGEQRYQMICAEAFVLLRQWLKTVADHPEAGAQPLLEKAAAISPRLAQFLEAGGFAVSYRRICENHFAGTGRLAAFHIWFDALRTRRLLTLLSPEQNSDMDIIVGQILSAGGYPGVAGKDQQLQLLERLQS